MLIELNYRMAARLPTHVQYRNATYYGAMEQYQRHGHGLLVLDNSQILLGRFDYMQLSGAETLSTESMSSSRII